MENAHPQQSTQAKQRVTTVKVLALAILFVFLRLLARSRKHVLLGVDDYTLVAFISPWNGAPYVHCPSVGFSCFLTVYAFEPLYITTVGIIKLSVLLMYYRIFPVRLIRIGGMVLASITVAWVISVDLVAIFRSFELDDRFSLILSFEAQDIAWTLADAETWCVVETAAGVISACLPTVIPLYQHACRNFVDSLSRSGGTDLEAEAIALHAASETQLGKIRVSDNRSLREPELYPPDEIKTVKGSSYTELTIHFRDSR
ncbi:uncharacterized protein BO97DRAFT_446589 [Aspergillus homomorphus CBS 101889]|uniref:Rhodopsin domain-containing protein n=1 Tax=Aspergillus homomorphus (strain CBS 101889) TaxID=1450537 RepID=A0A395HKU0_ASPHC|nr:hypothetical protein BO97DRAFT_446589 [Aspergillus homomorphus CBS 101889]RAL07835.1 hypothetical protein BO97DRAFT_446589 [Aspergillus homomorphus CBS 101889]